MRRGVGVSWLVVMAIVAVVAGLMVLDASRRNRAWLLTAARVQKQAEALSELHKENELLRAKLASLEEPTRMIYLARTLGLTRHWRSVERHDKANAKGLARFGTSAPRPRQSGAYAMRGDR